MLVYNYGRYNEYVDAQEAFLDPLASEQAGKPVYVLPNKATFIRPLVQKDGFAICFNEQLQVWQYEEDHRQQTVYSKEDLSPKVWTVLGPISDEYLTELPVPENDYQIWKDGNYVYPDILILKQQIKQELDNKYNKKINVPYKCEDYYVLPSWANTYTNTLVAMQEDEQDNGVLDEVYKVLLLKEPLTNIFEQITITKIKDFQPYYDKVKEVYKELTQEYHRYIASMSVINEPESLIDLIEKY